jgi:hypothetical protein
MTASEQLLNSDPEAFTFMLFCVISRNREQFHTSTVLILVIAPRFCKFGGGISLLGRANGRWLLLQGEEDSERAEWFSCLSFQATTLGLF